LKKEFYILLFFSLSLLKGSVFASTYTSKPGGGNWGTAAIWDVGVVPNNMSNADVVINSNVTVNGAYIIHNLTINNGCVLTINSGCSLTV